MGKVKEQWMDQQEEWFTQHLACVLGISHDELRYLEPVLHEDSLEEGLFWGYTLEFLNHADPRLLTRIERLDDDRLVRLDPWEIEEAYYARELEWDISSSDQLMVYVAQLESAERILKLNAAPDIEFDLLVMIHAHIVSGLERYLSSLFIHKVTNSDDLMRKLIESDSELGKRKFTLGEIYTQHEALNSTVADYLHSLVFHRIGTIKSTFGKVLGYDFGDTGWLVKAISTRHDCSHRAGYDKQGKKAQVSIESIAALVVNCRGLAKNLDRHVN